MRWLLLMGPVAMLVALGCADAEGSATAGSGRGGAGGSDDGRLRPEPNGVRISEADACDQLQTAFQERLQFLNCPGMTTRLCPGFVRVHYDPDCVTFDEGSVQGCVDHFNATNRCEQLDDSSCVATVYPGSEPAVCD